MFEEADVSHEEKLADAIRDMLDFTVGFCRPMTDAEKLDAIRKIGEKALEGERQDA